MTVYHSLDLMRFEGPALTTLDTYWYAPEVVEEGGQEYIGGYNKSGVSLRRLAWR